MSAPWESVQSVRRAFLLLRELGERPTRRTAPDLARSVALSKPTVYRLLRALEECGAVRRDEETRTYELGAALSELGRTTHHHVQLRTLAAGPMLALRDATGESAALYVRATTAEYVCVDLVPGRHDIRRLERIGRPMPLDRGATSQVFVADLVAHIGEQAVIDLLAGVPDFLGAHDLVEYVRAARSTMSTGVAESIDQHSVSAGSIAAPIVIGGTRTVAAINISGPSVRFSATDLEPWRHAVRRAAEAISRRLAEASAREKLST